MNIGLYVFIVFAVLFVLASFVTVQQGMVAVITVFGKYRRILTPGLNFKIPFIEKVNKKISIQNRSAELGFQATTIDQANVNFTSMLLYAVFSQDEETIKSVAFKFVDERNFMQALVRTVEGSVRAFVATKKQAEILTLRREIVDAVKDNLDKILEEWGYHLIDLQINDIAFAAQAEKEAAQLRGQGISLFREEVAKGMSSAAKMMSDADLDASVILFSMWTESIKHFAENGKGNVIFLDGSTEGMQKTMKDMMALQSLDTTANQSRTKKA